MQSRPQFPSAQRRTGPPGLIGALASSHLNLLNLLLLLVSHPNSNTLVPWPAQYLKLPSSSPLIAVVEKRRTGQEVGCGFPRGQCGNSVTEPGAGRGCGTSWLCGVSSRSLSAIPLVPASLQRGLGAGRGCSLSACKVVR